MKFILTCILIISSTGVIACAQQAQKVSDDSVYSTPKEIGSITNKRLREVSGMTPSRTKSGLWWINNDSGDKPRLYAVNSKGELITQFTVTGAKNRDWEDIGGYTDKNGVNWLYIGDTGNNKGRRSNLTIYRVKEPDLSKTPTSTSSKNKTENAESLPFTYPDSNQDAEAIFIDQNSGRPYIVTKSMTMTGGLYRFPMPLTPGRRVTLERVDGIAADKFSHMFMVTGAAISKDGNRIVVRNYSTAWEITRPGNSASFEDIFNAPPNEVKLPTQNQGEAISYSLDGKSLIITSEKTPAPIFTMQRKGN